MRLARRDPLRILALGKVLATWPRNRELYPNLARAAQGPKRERRAKKQVEGGHSFAPANPPLLCTPQLATWVLMGIIVSAPPKTDAPCNYDHPPSLGLNLHYAPLRV